MDLQTLIDNVSGFTSLEELQCLQSFASQVKPPLVILEVGTYVGLSALAIADKTQEGVQVYTLDPEGGILRDKFNDNVKKYNTRGNLYGVDLPSNTFRPLWNNKLKIGMLFVDGNHGEKSTREDVENWIQFMPPGGFIAIHDINSMEVIKGVLPFLDNMELVDSIGILNVYKLKG